MNILGENKKNSRRVVGVIVQAVTPGWWIIKDDQGRKQRVAGSGMYRRGEPVVVVSNQIIENSKMVKTKTKRVSV